MKNAPVNAVSNNVVLIADDEISLQTLLKRRLEASGFTCLSAATGKEAVRIANEQKPKLIILDLMMPDMNGYEAYKLIRQNREMKNTRVIFFTAQNPSLVTSLNANEGDAIDAVDKLDFVFKPFDGRAVLMLVKEALADQFSRH